MAARRPVIGVTGPDAGGGAAWAFTWFAVWLAGGRAVRITPRRPRAIGELDGLILGGGADVDPELYGAFDLSEMLALNQPRERGWRNVRGLLLLPVAWMARKLAGMFSASQRTAARDVLELGLIDAAMQGGLPILGICRGAQLLNVYFGGSLYQELSGFYVETPQMWTLLPRKPIRIDRGTRLSQILGLRRLVNALHRQAINELGADLRVCARDDRQIVQAVEHRAAPFVVGVQWHPEYLPQLPEQRAIFRAMVSEARRRYADRPRRGVRAADA